MAKIGVPAAAERLGVSPGRVRQRISEGSLPAEWVGRQWLVDERDLAALGDRSDPGRPLSDRSAWAVIVLASARRGRRRPRSPAHWLAALSPPDRSRARKRLRKLLSRHQGAADEHQAADAAAAVRLLLGNRAERVLLRASPRDLSDLADDDRVSRAGLSSPDSGIVAGDLVEAYVGPSDLSALIDDYLLDRVERDDDANIVFHVVPEELSEQVRALWRSEPMIQLLLAADLAEHRRPREQARAAALVAELARHLDIPAGESGSGHG